jgi:hypothetical protein
MDDRVTNYLGTNVRWVAGDFRRDPRIIQMALKVVF